MKIAGKEQRELETKVKIRGYVTRRNQSNNNDPYFSRPLLVILSEVEWFTLFKIVLCKKVKFINDVD
jgi:hypothetical protein